MNEVKELGTILGIWAHPDDETWAMGGLMAMAAKNGQRVVCVTATKGDAGKTANQKKWPQEQLTSIRTNEMAAALQVLGVKEHHWLDYKDGKLDQADEPKAVDTLMAMMDAVQPDTIITFEPQGVTGHGDHKTISRWTCTAAKKAAPQAEIYGACEVTEKYKAIGKYGDSMFNIYFNTKQPVTVAAKDADLYIELSPEILKMKLAALKAHASQMHMFFAVPLGKKFLTKLTESECFIKLK